MIRRSSLRWSVLALLVAACEPTSGPSPDADTTPVGATARPSNTATVEPGASSTATRPASAPIPSATASVARPMSESAARYAKLPDEDVTKLVTPYLAKKETIAHPPFQGPFGPSQDTIVVMTKKENDDFGGFILVEHGGTTKRIDMPTLQESWPGLSVDAIGFVEECDGDSVEELVVISQHQSGKLPATVVSVIDYDGKEFHRLQDVETLAVKAKTIADVREILGTRTFIMYIDSVPVRLAPTIQPDALQARLEKLMGVDAKPTVTSDSQELVFEYADKKGEPPASFAFVFNDAKVLQRLTLLTTSENGDAEALNPTARKLAAWLTKDVGAGKTEGSKTTWEHNGWRFVLDVGAQKERYEMVITPAS